MDGSGGGSGGPETIVDTRFEYMGSFVQKTLKLKPEKWMRLSMIEEHKTTIKEFMDRPVPMQLIVVLTQAAQLIPQTSFPLTQLKTKGKKCNVNDNLQFKKGEIKKRSLICLARRLFYQKTAISRSERRLFGFPYCWRPCNTIN